MRLMACAALLLGCGSASVGAGDFGRLTYTLHSDFVVESGSLREVVIVARHPQRLGVSLTDLGEDAADDEGEEIEHALVPDDGVTVELLPSGDEHPPDLQVTVDVPGDYVLESRLDGAVFDQLPLRFDAPSSLDLVTWARAPDAEDWTRAGGTLTLGTQLAFVPIPQDALGERLAGDLRYEVGAAPDGAVVPVENVLGVYEQNVWSSDGPRSAVVVAEGQVTVSVIDVPNGVQADRDYTVTP